VPCIIACVLPLLGDTGWTLVACVSHPLARRLLPCSSSRPARLLCLTLPALLFHAGLFKATWAPFCAGRHYCAYCILTRCLHCCSALQNFTLLVDAWDKGRQAACCVTPSQPPATSASGVTTGRAARAVPRWFLCNAFFFAAGTCAVFSRASAWAGKHYVGDMLRWRLSVAFCPAGVSLRRYQLICFALVSAAYSCSLHMPAE